jgi:endonuclease-3
MSSEEIPAPTPWFPAKGRESKASKTARAAEIVRRLTQRYPDPTTALTHGSAWELLVATILSAQSTDETVNKVTPGLFARWPDAFAMAGVEQGELEVAIHATGFFRNKAKSVLGAAQAVVERHDGEVPSTMEELTALPGVGRKTANVVLGTYFGINDGVVVDTHVGRLASRLKLTANPDPVKAEQDLMKVVPRPEWTNFSHRLIYFGREVCTAKDPRCDLCDLADLCPSAFKVGRFAPKKKPRATRKPAGRQPVRTAAKPPPRRETGPPPPPGG